MTRIIRWAALCAAVLAGAAEVRAQESEGGLGYRRRQFSPPRVTELEAKARAIARPAGIPAASAAPAEAEPVQARDLRKTRKAAIGDFARHTAAAKRDLARELDRRYREDVFFPAYVYIDMARWADAVALLGTMPAQLTEDPDKRIRSGDHLVLIGMCKAQGESVDAGVAFLRLQASRQPKAFQKRAEDTERAIGDAARTWAEREAELDRTPTGDALLALVELARDEKSYFTRNSAEAYGCLVALETHFPDHPKVHDGSARAGQAMVLERAHCNQPAREIWKALPERFPHLAKFAEQRAFEVERRIKAGGF